MKPDQRTINTYLMGRGPDLLRQTDRHSTARTQVQTLDTRRLIDKTLRMARRQLDKRIAQLLHIVSLDPVIAFIHSLEHRRTISLEP